MPDWFVWFCAPFLLLAFVGGILLVVMLVLIVSKAMEKPQPGTSTDYRLEQGHEVDGRSGTGT